jgi:S-DNA-T family DNA segregation ATPase FtsK/SpoIIIE
MQQLIETTLEDFSVPVRVVHVETGPTVTQFGVEPLYVERAGQKRKVRVSRIVSLADDLALALAAPAVRMEAPVPGRPYVGIEVPNTDKALVGLRGILESPAMGKDGGVLALPLGRDTSGKPVVMDLTRAPHMLIAGQTGSGKSVCINTIITGLLMQHGPESLRFVMIDPKMVELPGYNGIPHLMGKVITDMDQVMGALTWLLIQMDDRYQMFRAAGVRNIDAYNAKARRSKELDHLPYIVLIVDELADLMMTAAEDVERQICRLAQMARATGIHLILATQRPSTDVVTGLIKANFPTRVAFAVTSQIDSRVILDQPGAEKLLGRGDMLLMRPDVAKLFRVQGCWVADGEIENITHFWKEAETEVDTPRIAPWNGLMDRMDDEDELINEAIDVIRDMETCSASMLQRKLRIGYPKAARLIEDLEKRGAVGPDLGGGQGRPVLVKRNEDDADDEDGEEEEYL